jgi:hypothetical protein
MEPDLDPGAYIGQGEELAHDAGAVDVESTGPGGMGAVRDPGWQKTPEGHREGTIDTDDEIRRKG